MTLGLAAASAMMVACNQKDSTPTAASPATETTTAANPDIVYVNSDSLLANYEYFKDVRNRLQKKAEQKEKDLRTQAESFQKEVQRFQQNAPTMTQQQAQATEQRLMQKQQQLQALQQSSGNELMTEESEEMNKIYDRVEEYLKQLSTEQGYKMVLTYQRGNSAILYGDSTLDVTKEVVDALNKTYESEKAEADKKKEAEKKK
ncbi:periplasmic chaperone for outer membrane proteins Skp [Pontibacter mucosus]|uniref:Periplasmic chaperone for outer membrane proteins Skp n=1 Tax=Pontibacter mucosus TaxID=1649266 RepID=A0A2T5YLH9_9BACT|nr:OmpH family outer membrane protein [Pontibacter mucosus]PTX20137.1 periplasmic chaperone for outer membrane proteins Skp [Pontibacter mucosus]